MNTIDRPAPSVRCAASSFTYCDFDGRIHPRENTPFLNPTGAIVAEVSADRAFNGSIPVMTLSLFDMQNMYSFDEKILSKLCLAGLVPHVGDPAVFHKCQADLECAARAYAIWSRYSSFGIPADEVASIVRNPETGGLHLRNTLSELMRGACYGRAHQGFVCGEHPAPEGYDYVKSFPAFRAIENLRAYMRKPAR